tara:strand:- start:3968 stop:4075 length:108 start_codon:yes stop_codon:yes gene_type:complete
MKYLKGIIKHTMYWLYMIGYIAVIGVVFMMIADVV